MRSNIVFGLLIALLVLLTGFTVMRQREARSHTPVSSPPSAAPPSATPTATASSTPALAPTAISTASSATTVAPAPPKPELDRPLRVIGLGWELLSADIMANGGLSTTATSVFHRLGIDLTLAAHTDVSQLENALARGGSDDKGADIALLPLPRFVASYERLKALDPMMFLVVAWSDGREVILSKSTSFAKLPPHGSLALRAEPGSAAAFFGMWSLQLAGLPAKRVQLVSEADEHSWAALTRRQSEQSGAQGHANLLLTTGEASRLVPIVAVAQSSLLASSPHTLAAWTKGRIDGEKLAAEAPTEAARMIGRAKGAPEPLAVLSSMGQLSPASLADSAELAGLSGRGAVTLDALFRQSWQIWRDAKVLTIPPEHAPIDGSIIAMLVRGGAKLGAPTSSKAASSKPSIAPSDHPLIVHRVAQGENADARLVDTIGFIAGVFRRSRLRITAHPRLIVDAKHSAQIIESALARFAIAADRLTPGKARPRPNTIATIEVMRVE